MTKAQYIVAVLIDEAMGRRNFLKRLGLGVASAVAGPAMNLATEPELDASLKTALKGEEHVFFHTGKQLGLSDSELRRQWNRHMPDLIACARKSGAQGVGMWSMNTRLAERPVGVQQMYDKAESIFRAEMEEWVRQGQVARNKPAPKAEPSAEDFDSEEFMGDKSQLASRRPVDDAPYSNLEPDIEEPGQYSDSGFSHSIS
jgi:hypothetical protein